MTIPRNQKGLCLWDLNVKEMGKVCARVTYKCNPTVGLLPVTEAETLNTTYNTKDFIKNLIRKDPHNIMTVLHAVAFCII